MATPSFLPSFLFLHASDIGQANCSMWAKGAQPHGYPVTCECDGERASERVPAIAARKKIPALFASD